MDGFECECPLGTSGVRCEMYLDATTESSDACISDPCAHGGTCSVKTDGGFKCLCATGYRGKTCEMPLSVCSSDPCQNGGICNASMDGFVCDCKPGFEGLFCQDIQVPTLTCDDKFCNGNVSA